MMFQSIVLEPSSSAFMFCCAQGSPSPLSHWCILQFPPYLHKIYTFPPVSVKFLNCPYFRSVYAFLLNLHFLLPTILTMMHLCIMFYTYWLKGDGHPWVRVTLKHDAPSWTWPCAANILKLFLSTQRMHRRKQTQLHYWEQWIKSNSRHLPSDHIA